MNEVMNTLNLAAHGLLDRFEYYLANGPETEVFIVSVCVLVAVAAIAVIALVLGFRLMRDLLVFLFPGGVDLSPMFSRDVEREELSKDTDLLMKDPMLFGSRASRLDQQYTIIDGNYTFDDSRS